jgi:hypothetical protein
LITHDNQGKASFMGQVDDFLSRVAAHLFNRRLAAQFFQASLHFFQAPHVKGLLLFHSPPREVGCVLVFHHLQEGYRRSAFPGYVFNIGKGPFASVREVSGEKDVLEWPQTNRKAALIPLA